LADGIPYCELALFGLLIIYEKILLKTAGLSGYLRVFVEDAIAKSFAN
jgi:hypothetical protein